MKPTDRRGRTWRLLMALLVVLALIAAACGDDDDDTSAADDGAADDGAADDGAADDGAADDGAADDGAADDGAADDGAADDGAADDGAADDGGPATGEPIELGAMFDTTGPFSGLGGPMRDAFELTIEMINEEGGINGRPLEIQVEDSETSPDRAVEITRNYVNDGYPVIFGPTSSGATQAAIEITGPEGIITYSYSGGPFEWQPTFFAANFPPFENLGSVPLAFFEEMGWNRFACLRTSDASGDAYEGSIGVVIENFDVEMVAVETFEPGDTDVTAQLTNIRDADPDVIYSCNSGANILPILQGVVQLGLDIPVFAGAGSLVFPVIEAAADTIPSAGLFSGGSWVMIPDQVPEDYPGRELVQSFTSAFEERYGAKLDGVAATAVDSALIVAEAMRTGATTGEEIAAAIEGLQDFQGLLSSYSFGPDDHRGTQIQPLVLRWTEEGELMFETELDL